MFEVIAEHFLQGRRIAGVLVSGNLVRRRSGDRHGGAEERLGGFLIAGLAQVDVDQVAVAVDRSVRAIAYEKSGRWFTAEKPLLRAEERTDAGSSAFRHPQSELIAPLPQEAAPAFNNRKLHMRLPCPRPRLTGAGCRGCLQCRRSARPSTARRCRGRPCGRRGHWGDVARTRPP